MDKDSGLLGVCEPLEDADSSNSSVTLLELPNLLSFGPCLTQEEQSP